MLKRDFFRVLIKTSAIFAIIITVFKMVPSELGNLILHRNPVYSVWILAMAAVPILFFRYLLFRTDKVIDILKLEQGFDSEKIDLGECNVYNLINVALIIMGGILVVENLGNFALYCFTSFKSSIQNKSGLANMIPDYYIDPFKWAISVLNLVLGYIILTHYSKISKFLLKSKN